MRRRSLRDRQKPTRPESLKLTSMMDILTVLLLFLLKSFVVEGEVVTPPPGVELPGSTADTPPEASLVIAISNDVNKPDYCNACEGECGPEYSLSAECQAEGAYGG